MIITLDLETTGLDWKTCKINLNGYRINRVDPIFYAPTDRVDSSLNDLLRNPDNVLSGHNVGAFDALVLSAHGYEVNCKFEDTRVMAYLEWPTEEDFSLKALVRRKLRKEVTELDDILFKPLKKELQYFDSHKEEYYTVDDMYVRKDLLLRYHQDDIRNVDLLREQLHPTPWFIRVEQPLTRMLFELQRYGTPIDKANLDLLEYEYDKKAEEYKSKLGAVDPGKKKQLLAYFEANGVDLSKCEKTKKTKEAKIDKQFLKALSWSGSEFAKNLLEYRRYEKILSTYIRPIGEGIQYDGRLHGSFNQAGSEDIYGDGARGTNTGRLSSSNPNLQNIPARTEIGKAVREVFTAPEDEFLFVKDLKQIEPRYIAHLSQAPILINAYKQHLDTHGIFASSIFGRPVDKLSAIERFIGKTGWLATTYRCGPKRLLYQCEYQSDNYLDLPGIAVGDLDGRLEFIRGVQGAFRIANPEIIAWSDAVVERAKKLGYIETYGMRKIKLPLLYSRDRTERWDAERKAINYTVQGSCADIIKLIMLRFQEEFVRAGLGRILLCVHDEIVGTLKRIEDLKVVDEIMNNTIKLLNVEIESSGGICENWAEGK